jgi:hypothetical protein
MIPLRLAALASNVAFIAYGVALDLTPIWLLHALLVPLNGYRLVGAARLLRARTVACETRRGLHRRAGPPQAWLSTDTERRHTNSSQRSTGLGAPERGVALQQPC